MWFIMKSNLGNYCLELHLDTHARTPMREGETERSVVFLLFIKYKYQLFTIWKHTSAQACALSVTQWVYEKLMNLTLQSLSGLPLSFIELK